MSKPKNSKERNVTLTMEFEKPVSIDSFCVDDKCEIRVFSDNAEITPKTCLYDKWYEGKRKIKHTVTFETTKLSLDVHSIICDYNYIVALDTNFSNDEWFSAGVCFKIINKKSELALEYITSIFKKFDKNEIGENGSSELVALHKFICFLQLGSIINDFSDQKILFVIDHHFSEIKKYNSHEVPLLENDINSLLPQNIQLIYAGDNYKNDSFFNQLIVICDNEANRMKKPEEYQKLLTCDNSLKGSDKTQIECSNYSKLYSGTECMQDYSSELDLHYEDKNTNLYINIKFIFIDDNGPVQTNSRIIDFNVYLLCKNYHGLHGVGTKYPIEIGEKNGKKYYLSYWMSDSNDTKKPKRVDYSIYSDK